MPQALALGTQALAVPLVTRQGVQRGCVDVSLAFEGALVSRQRTSTCRLPPSY